MRRAVTLFVLGMLALVGIAAGIYAPGGDASPGKANATVKITVKASEFKFALSRRAVPVGSTVVFTVINTGKISHDFKIAGKKTKTLQPKQKATLKVVFKKKGKIAYTCTLLGHAKAGMTTWIVGHTDRFRAACSERAVNNWTIESGTSDIGIFFKSYVGAHWFEEPDVYRALSPVTYAPYITTPLLIVHSEDDLRCPVGNAEELFTILRLLGREVELVRFPCASHELSRSGAPAQRVVRFETILEWFARHLAPHDVRVPELLAE